MNPWTQASSQMSPEAELLKSLGLGGSSSANSPQVEIKIKSPKPEKPVAPKKENSAAMAKSLEKAAQAFRPATKPMVGNEPGGMATNPMPANPMNVDSAQSNAANLGLPELAPYKIGSGLSAGTEASDTDQSGGKVVSKLPISQDQYDALYRMHTQSPAFQEAEAGNDKLEGLIRTMASAPGPGIDFRPLEAGVNFLTGGKYKGTGAGPAPAEVGPKDILAYYEKLQDNKRDQVKGINEFIRSSTNQGMTEDNYKIIQGLRQRFAELDFHIPHASELGF